MLSLDGDDGHKGTIVFTNASAALKGYPRSGAFAAACYGKAGLAQSMARELMPQGSTWRKCLSMLRSAGSNRMVHARIASPVRLRMDNMAHPDRIAEVYWQLHRQHKSTWAFEVVLRPGKRTGRTTGRHRAVGLAAGLYDLAAQRLRWLAGDELLRGRLDLSAAPRVITDDACSSRCVHAERVTRATRALWHPARTFTLAADAARQCRGCRRQTHGLGSADCAVLSRGADHRRGPRDASRC
jgi:hypothetical protein